MLDEHIRNHIGGAQAGVFADVGNDEVVGGEIEFFEDFGVFGLGRESLEVYAGIYSFHILESGFLEFLL